MSELRAREQAGMRAARAAAARESRGAAAAHLERPSILSACLELLSRATLSMMFHSSSMLHLRTRCTERVKRLKS